MAVGSASVQGCRKAVVGSVQGCVCVYVCFSFVLFVQAAAQPAAQPFNMFGGPVGAGGGQGEGNPLEFLANHPQFQLMRRAVQGNPQILVPMLQVRQIAVHSTCERESVNASLHTYCPA